MVNMRDLFLTNVSEDGHVSVRLRDHVDGVPMFDDWQACTSAVVTDSGTLYQVAAFSPRIAKRLLWPERPTNEKPTARQAESFLAQCMQQHQAPGVTNIQEWQDAYARDHVAAHGHAPDEMLPDLRLALA